MHNAFQLKIAPFKRLQRDSDLQPIAKALSNEIKDTIIINEQNKKNKVKEKGERKEMKRKKKKNAAPTSRPSTSNQPITNRSCIPESNHEDSDFDFVDDDTVF